MRDTSAGADPKSFEHYGHTVGGPLVCGMVDWLASRLRAERPDRVLFLARDGQILREVWEKRAPSDLHEVPHDYLLVSRRALRVATFDAADASTRAAVSAGFDGLTAHSFLARLGLSSEMIAHGLAQAGGVPADTLLSHTRPGEAEALLAAVEDDLTERAGCELRALQAYVDGVIPESDRRIAVVDVGWHGSMRKGLHDVLTSMGRACVLDGYYVGLYEVPVENRLASGAHEGFLVTGDHPADRARELPLLINLVEILLGSPDPGLLCFGTDGEGNAVPVYAAPEAAAAQTTRIRRGILRFADEQTAPIPPAEAYAPLKRVGLRPTARDAKRLGAFTLSPGFGDSPPLRLVHRRGFFRRHFHWPTLYQDCKTSLWRPGQWALLNPFEKWILRIIHPEGTKRIVDALRGSAED